MDTKDKNEMMKLENQLCFPLYAAARSMTGLYTPWLKQLGLTYTQYITFLVLWEKDGITVGEICNRLMLDNGTVSPLLKKMEEHSLILRRRCPDDERCVRVSLTQKGSDLKEKAREIPMQVGSCITLEAEEALQLYRTLYKLLGADCPVA